MLDVMGQQLREGKLAQLLCEVLRIDDGQIVLRVMNSEMELAVGSKHDEVLGGDVADSELLAFEPNQEIMISDNRDSDGVKICPME